MLRSPWEWLLLGTMIGGPLTLKLRGRPGDRVFLLAWFHLVYGSLYVVLAPAGEPNAAAASAIGLLGFDLVLRFSASLGDRLTRRFRSRRAMAAMVVSSICLVPMAGVEVGCRGLTNAGVLRYHQPIETVWKTGHDDWRVATITADIHREPDPVLLWRPVAGKPYNAQRFKGPLIETPKPPGVLRVFCYGDSLTDGPVKGDWPTRLHRLLGEQSHQSGRRIEVVNAGVAGYSSHQGLLRFIQEVDRYQPDLILAGFGWNDVAQASGPPDRMFRPPAAPIVALQRAMVRYRAYLVLTAYMKSLLTEPAPAASGQDNPRVSIPDYLANMERFRTEAQARGIPVVFLTRPHRAAVEELRQYPNWRRHVPEYNEALAAWASERQLPLIDARRYFSGQPVELFSDECHFVPDGYELMAKLVRDRLFAGPTPILGRAGGRPVERTASSREP